MTISIVLATYNRLPLLRETLSTVSAQTHADWECLVCDDGSSDGTVEFVEGLARQDPRFRLVQGPRFGRPSGPRNRGIQHAAGEWVAFLDDDDLWHPDKLARQVAAAGDSSQAVSTATVMFPEAQPPAWEAHPAESPVETLTLAGVLLQRRPYPTTPATMVRRRALLALGGFAEHEAYRAVEDYDLWSRLVQRWPGRWPIVLGPPLTAARDAGTDSISAWNRELHPDVVRQRWAMLEIVTRMLAADTCAWRTVEREAYRHLADLADDCGNRSRRLGWRRDAVLAYLLAARFAARTGDAQLVRRLSRVVRFGVAGRADARGARPAAMRLLARRVLRNAHRLVHRQATPVAPLALDGGDGWSTLRPLAETPGVS